MDKSNFAFGKINYILLAIGMLIIITGFILMSGTGTTEEAFDPEIFNATRTKTAPVVSLFGFIFVVVAILWKPKRKEVAKVEEEKTAEIEQ
jgi:ribose/xylose/arabinose/galactoside ABC-type transport system permease subunit